MSQYRSKYRKVNQNFDFQQSSGWIRNLYKNQYKNLAEFGSMFNPKTLNKYKLNL